MTPRIWSRTIAGDRHGDGVAGDADRPVHPGILEIGLGARPRRLDVDRVMAVAHAGRRKRVGSYARGLGRGPRGRDACVDDSAAVDDEAEEDCEGPGDHKDRPD